MEGSPRKCHFELQPEGWVEVTRRRAGSGGVFWAEITALPKALKEEVLKKLKEGWYGQSLANVENWLQMR